MKQFFCAIAFFAILAMGLSSCKKETTAEWTFPEYVAFGRFTTGCTWGETCVEIFKLDQSLLVEDINDQVPQPGVLYQGNYSASVPQNDRAQIELLIREALPESLLKKPNGAIGTNPVWNQNYFYFEYAAQGRHGYWIIDGSFDGTMSAEMNNFINILNQAVSMASF